MTTQKEVYVDKDGFMWNDRMIAATHDITPKSFKALCADHNLEPTHFLDRPIGRVKHVRQTGQVVSGHSMTWHQILYLYKRFNWETYNPDSVRTKIRRRLAKVPEQYQATELRNMLIDDIMPLTRASRDGEYQEVLSRLVSECETSFLDVSSAGGTKSFDLLRREKYLDLLQYLPPHLIGMMARYYINHYHGAILRAFV